MIKHNHNYYQTGIHVGYAEVLRRKQLIFWRIGVARDISGLLAHIGVTRWRIIGVKYSICITSAHDVNQYLPIDFSVHISK